ncbi:MAG: AzlC family ABC transporter permease [Nitriliruptorales bacterium]|nr:AzlC family ABC transporter permease [Nitriliruptorales bacterium]
MTATTSTIRSRVRPEGVLDRDALRDILPVTVSVVPFALIIGVTIARAGSLANWIGLFSGFGYYSGSAQLASVTLVAAGSTIPLVVGTTAIINARLLMYGAALQPHFQHQPAWFRWLGPHYLVDQTYALATARPELGDDPERFRRYWVSMGAVLGGGWMLAMTTGVLAGPVLPRIEAFDFAVPAVFIGLLVPRLREKAARRPALLAAVAAVIASPLPHGLGLLVGALAGLSPHFFRSKS